MSNGESTSCIQVLRLSPDFHAGRRAALQAALGDGFLVLLAAGRPPRRTADENYAFFANRNFYYLTGVEQDNSVLLMFRKAGQSRDILFIPPADPMIERWNGKRLKLNEAADCSGVPEIEYLSSFEGILSDLLASRPAAIYIDKSSADVQAAELHALLAQQTPGVEPLDLAPFLVRLRMIKTDEEISLMREAITLTGRGIRAMLDIIRPGRMEYELWSAFRHALAMEGCLTPAFAPIVASGENALCLHHMNPKSRIGCGDLVQIDVGAIVGGL